MNEETIVFTDEGFLGKLSKHFGNGKYIKIDCFRFVRNLAKKENPFFKHLFYYTTLPLQETPPIKEQRKRKEDYDNFIKSLSKKKITIRESRCQKLKINGKFKFKQRGVNVLITIELNHIKENFPEIKKMVLEECNIHFCPIIEDIKKRNTEVILYTQFNKKGNSSFSRANHLINPYSEYFH